MLSRFDTRRLISPSYAFVFQGWYRQKLSQQAAAAKAKKEGAESSMSAEEKRRINEQCFEQWLARKRDLEAKVGLCNNLCKAKKQRHFLISNPLLPPPPPPQ